MNYYFEIIVFNSALSDILKKTATIFLEIFRHAAPILCIHVFSEFSGKGPSINYVRFFGGRGVRENLTFSDMRGRGVT